MTTKSTKKPARKKAAKRPARKAKAAPKAKARSKAKTPPKEPGAPKTGCAGRASGTRDCPAPAGSSPARSRARSTGFRSSTRASSTREDMAQPLGDREGDLRDRVERVPVLGPPEAREGAGRQRADGRCGVTRRTTDPRPLLREGAIYWADNGRRICARCAGASALYTGRDISGQPVERATLRDSVEWLSSLGSMLACERGCTVLGLIAGPHGWPNLHHGPAPADVPAAVEDAMRRMGGAL